jgi:hypothetical protein
MGAWLDVPSSIGIHSVLPEKHAVFAPTERGCICAVNSDQNKEEQVMRPTVNGAGRALRHEYENKQQEMPERMRQLVARLETAGKPQNEGSSD